MSEKKTRERGPYTDLFERSFTGGGGINMDCGFCGRHHFEDDEHAGDWEEGELERLRDMAGLMPDKYVAHQDGVMYSNVNGNTYVRGCPCNACVPYEEFIWRHRQQIAEYLKARSDEIWRVAQLEHALLGTLPEQVKV